MKVISIVNIRLGEALQTVQSGPGGGLRANAVKQAIGDAERFKARFKLNKVQLDTANEVIRQGLGVMMHYNKTKRGA